MEEKKKKTKEERRKKDKKKKEGKERKLQTHYFPKSSSYTLGDLIGSHGVLCRQLRNFCSGVNEYDRGTMLTLLQH
jgi:hypothetical protein